MRIKSTCRIVVLSFASTLLCAGGVVGWSWGEESSQTPVGPVEESAVATDLGSALAAADYADVSPTETASFAASDYAESAPAAAAAEKPQPAKPKKPQPPPSPYKGVFYDNDFSALRQTGPQYLGDRLKLLEVPACSPLEVGGEYRARYESQHNMVGLDLNRLSDDFLLQRTRIYGSWKVVPWFRAYAEGLDATREFERHTLRTIDENRFDALNLFGDLLVRDTGQGQLWARVGRQEMLYGAERLISPLDWANTRRTFDGAKVFWRGGQWNVDGFWTRPVPLFQHLDSDSNFDHPDQSQEFLGLYSTYKGIKDQTWDFYYLRLAEYDAPRTSFLPVNFDVHTFGSRWYAKRGSWLAELEGGYQFGDWGNLDQRAGFFVVGGGHEWSDVRAKPTLWIYYDWASGDADPNDSSHNTFIQLFPLVHKYFGFMDLVARQNIQDFNMLWTATPTKRGKFLAWWHVFHLDEARDALYNAAGVPIRRDPTGAAGTDVGQELDLIYQIQLHPRRDILFGYSHFWPGSFITAAPNNPPGVSGQADFFYTQFSWKF